MTLKVKNLSVYKLRSMVLRLIGIITIFFLNSCNNQNDKVSISSKENESDSKINYEKKDTIDRGSNIIQCGDLTLSQVIDSSSSANKNYVFERLKIIADGKYFHSKEASVIEIDEQNEHLTIQIEAFGTKSYQPDCDDLIRLSSEQAKVFLPVRGRVDIKVKLTPDAERWTVRVTNAKFIYNKDSILIKDRIINVFNRHINIVPRTSTLD